MQRVILPVVSDADALRTAYGPALTDQGFTEKAEASENGSLLFTRA